jgi:hypothetical protein
MHQYIYCAFAQPMLMSQGCVFILPLLLLVNLFAWLSLVCAALCVLPPPAARGGAAVWILSPSPSPALLMFNSDVFDIQHMQHAEYV